MPSYLSPGVYVEEVSGGVKPIAGVGTSTGAFVGIAEKGITNKAVLVTNWSQYVKEFGKFIPNGYLAYGVYSFFAEGGTSCWVVRVVPTGSTLASCKGIKDKADTAVLDLEARSIGTHGNRITVIIGDASDNKDSKDVVIDAKLFKVTVKYAEATTFKSEYEGDGITEVFDRVSLLNIEEKINGVSGLINVTVKITLPTTDAAKKTFATRPIDGTNLLDGGKDNSDPLITELKDTDFVGNADDKNGLHAFDEVDGINIVAIPDKAGDREVILEGLNYCKNRRDCFFVADAPYGLTPSQVKDFKNASGATYSGQNAFNSSFGALYFPWVYINDPLSGKKKLVPPSGLVAGTYAYTDSTRGVHKAPAGISEGYLDSAMGIEQIVTKGEHDLLNPANVNVIRSLPMGICIWGARTLSADSEWTYINVRRLFLFLEKSIYNGMQWVVFEPNDPSLWGKVKRNVTAFLTRVWRDGALFGTTPEEAFFVKVDEENNPPEVRDAGQLIIEVGVAPVKPAEFVVIRISQKTLSK